MALNELLPCVTCFLKKRDKWGCGGVGGGGRACLKLGQNFGAVEIRWDTRLKTRTVPGKPGHVLTQSYLLMRRGHAATPCLPAPQHEEPGDLRPPHTPVRTGSSHIHCLPVQDLEEELELDRRRVSEAEGVAKRAEEELAVAKERLLLQEDELQNRAGVSVCSFYYNIEFHQIVPHSFLNNRIN